MRTLVRAMTSFVTMTSCRAAFSLASKASPGRTLSKSMVSVETFSTSEKSMESTVLTPLVVCGPSGVGKGTIIDRFMEEHGGKERFGFTVSHTTRQPRPGEVNGVHYHFADMDDMKRQIVDEKFMEYAWVHGNLYGTSWQSLWDVEEQGKRCVLDVDVQGVQNLKKLESHQLRPRYVFIAPPSLEILLERLSNRGTETAESLARRTGNAKAEVEYGLQPGNFERIVVNDDLDQACRDFVNAVNSMYN